VIVADLKRILFTPILGTDRPGFRDPPTLGDLEDPRPRDPEHFAYSMEAYIGDRDGDAADLFDGMVCSQSWLAARLLRDDEIGTQHLAHFPSPAIITNTPWIMRRWDRAEIERTVRLICDKYSPGPDWRTVADRIGRWLPWEYDYRYDEDVNRRHGIPTPPGWDA